MAKAPDHLALVQIVTFEFHSSHHSQFSEVF